MADTKKVNPLFPDQPAAKKWTFKDDITVKPGESHPGRTAEHGPAHDRKGSQPEQMRHLYPNGAVPKQGSSRSNKDPKARTGAYKKHSEK
ncbi:MAG: hypothetical protein ABIQ75_09105 [Flavobacteriales bacterium]